MAKKKDKPRKSEQEGMSPAFWLVPILSVINLLYFFLLAAGFPLPAFGYGLDRWKIGSIVFQVILVAVVALSHALDRRAPAAVCETDEAEVEEIADESDADTKAGKKAPVQQKPAPQAKPGEAKAQAKAVPPAKLPSAAAAVGAAPGEGARPAGKEIFEYPPKISGGIYADSQIPLGANRYLKLRTLVARSCLLCDEQERCWDIVSHEVEQDFFRSNIDCKEALNIDT